VGLRFAFDTEDFDVSNWYDTATGRLHAADRRLLPALTWNVYSNAILTADVSGSPSCARTALRGTARAMTGFQQGHGGRPHRAAPRSRRRTARRTSSRSPLPEHGAAANVMTGRSRTFFQGAAHREVVTDAEHHRHARRRPVRRPAAATIELRADGQILTPTT
jgi:hypothetical protein